MPSSDKAIEIQKLNLRLGQRTILDTISFEVNSGTILGILGRSGSGKTSLFRAILGVPTTTNLEQSGSIYFFGKDRKEIPIHHLQPVFQDPVGSFNPTWSLEKALKEPLRILGGEVANRGEAFFRIYSNLFGWQIKISIEMFFLFPEVNYKGRRFFVRFSRNLKFFFWTKR